MMKSALLMVAAAAACLLYGGTLPAQDWPARPVTLVVAFPAGGSDDILGRIVAARLSELLGQPVTVENVSGAGGMTGMLASQRPCPMAIISRSGHPPLTP